MKTLLTILLLSTFSAFGQLQFDYFGGLTINLNNPNTACFFFDFEGNGENDIKFVHGNGDCYVEGVSKRMFFPQYRSGLWKDCANTSITDFNYSKAYIRKNGITLSFISHCLPFTYAGVYGYFIINIIDSNTIKVRGYIANKTTFNCYDLNTATPISNNNVNQ